MSTEQNIERRRQQRVTADMIGQTNGEQPADGDSEAERLKLSMIEAGNREPATPEAADLTATMIEEASGAPPA